MQLGCDGSDRSKWPSSDGCFQAAAEGGKTASCHAGPKFAGCLRMPTQCGYSGTFSSGTSQSYSAQVAAPPSPRGYGRPLLLWGPVILFLSVWTVVSFRSILELPKTTMFRVDLAAVFLLLDVVSFVCLVFKLRSIARYNREVYPRLHWNWEHTYICRRCGKLRLIPS